MDDLISKLSEIRNDYNYFDEDEEPYYRALSEAIKILSQREDGDTISRAAAIDALEERLQANGYSNAALVSELNRSIGYLMRLPSAQPMQRRGNWYDVGSLSCRCSECGCKSPKEYSYCPNCGADMRGE